MNLKDVTKDEFIELYKSHTNKEIMDMFQLSLNKFSQIKKELDLSKKVGRRKDKILFKDGQL